jgi:hypothetical protein
VLYLNGVCGVYNEKVQLQRLKGKRQRHSGTGSKKRGSRRITLVNDVDCVLRCPIPRWFSGREAGIKRFLNGKD